MAKRGRPLPLPGHREPHHDRPPTGQKGRPTLATLPPFGRPTGAYGHRLPHWPPTGPLLAIRGGPDWPKGRPRLATGTGGGAYVHTGAPAPHFPATYGQRGAAPLTGLPLPPTGQKGRGGDAFARPSPDWPPTPPTGHPGTPQTFGSGGQREGAGVLSCIGGRYDVARVPYTPFGDPLPTD